MVVRVYFFRMYLCITLLLLLNGLFVFPLLLAALGPEPDF